MDTYEWVLSGHHVQMGIEVVEGVLLGVFIVISLFAFRVCQAVEGAQSQYLRIDIRPSALHMTQLGPQDNSNTNRSRALLLHRSLAMVGTSRDHHKPSCPCLSFAVHFLVCTDVRRAHGGSGATVARVYCVRRQRHVRAVVRGFMTSTLQLVMSLIARPCHVHSCPLSACSHQAGWAGRPRSVE